MTCDSQTVFVVDDEPVVRKAVSLILEQGGHRIETFASAAEFLERYDASQPGCLVSDVRMPGMDGMDLLRHLSQQGIRIPVVMLSAHGDIPMAIDAVKTGAIDFLEKPADPDVLRQKVAGALAMDLTWRLDLDETEEIKQLESTLTPREREVLRLLVDGKNAKIVAQILGSSYNTVRVQRASIMKKMRADNIADLVRMTNMIESIK
jgi:two-component system, LuxR family, response regulator FixJ